MGSRGLHSAIMETFRLLFFTTLWTAVWAVPLPKLSRRVELVAGLIPFAAFASIALGWKTTAGSLSVDPSTTRDVTSP
jgi:hypothetical protein